MSILNKLMESAADTVKLGEHIRDNVPLETSLHAARGIFEHVMTHPDATLHQRNMAASGTIRAINAIRQRDWSPAVDRRTETRATGERPN